MQKTPAANVNGWLDRLETLIQGTLSDTVVFHVLGLVRKIIEAEQSAEAFFYLNFFCDWAMHTKVDRKGARRVLGHFDERCPAILDSKDDAASAWRYYVLFAFHLQVQQFLKQHGLSEMSRQSWLEFLAEYLILISGCPATNGGKFYLSHLAEIVVDRSNSSRTSFDWKIVLNDGSEKRFPIVVDSFFGTNPTYGGEPWLWKGPVAAMVGISDGWMLHVNEPPGAQFSMYPVFETLETAMHRTLFLYGLIILKSEVEPTMEAIATRHERETSLRAPSATSERLPPLDGSSMIAGEYPRSLLRRANLVDLSGPEFCLYIDSPKGVLLLNLLYPPREESVSLEALRWIGSTALMMTRQNEFAPTGSQST